MDWQMMIAVTGVATMAGTVVNLVLNMKLRETQSAVQRELAENRLADQAQLAEKFEKLKDWIDQHFIRRKAA
ncbi:MAG: hypothetical protein ABSG29_05260 [Steroidobacteraceae bacterium]|jgi:hypothetical protein